MPFGRFRTHSPDRRSLSLNEGSESSKVQPPPLRTDTNASSISSTSDDPSSPRSSFSSRLPLSKLHSAVSRGATSSSSQSIRSLPEPETPVQLAELAISTILTIPGPSIEELRNEYFPKLFHEVYSHRANTREHGLKELERLIVRFRSKFEVSILVPSLIVSKPRADSTSIFPSQCELGSDRVSWIKMVQRKSLELDEQAIRY